MSKKFEISPQYVLKQTGPNCEIFEVFSIRRETYLMDNLFVSISLSDSDLSKTQNKQSKKLFFMRQQQAQKKKISQININRFYSNRKLAFYLFMTLYGLFIWPDFENKRSTGLEDARIDENFKTNSNNRGNLV
ncbi:hypothetical protein BpHYR1_021037 [Brachionus plicatilis]|uniref:Transmembrane protein n=1 Tax=Brachionus plicatilis TaxID=10195 RepID=A0A3M7R816_BRAPC|nr:hypothetical protein BpHYR1_021037 [Brachionus plicatilis]